MSEHANLGLATTRELMKELMARSQIQGQEDMPTGDMRFELGRALQEFPPDFLDYRTAEPRHIDNFDVTDRPEIELVHHIGGDISVLASMMVSTKASKALDILTNGEAEENEGKIRFLMKNRHGTPFEHNQFCFFVSAGIFVFREFHRHRIGWSYNEESARYKPLAPRFYVPAMARKQTGKPGHYVMEDAPELTEWFGEDITDAYWEAYCRYEKYLEAGISRELARLVLPVGIYSSMFATCNARSLMAFLSLRTEHERAQFPSKPQLEIQQVSAALEDAFAEHMPITYKAFCDFGRVAP